MQVQEKEARASAIDKRLHSYAFTDAFDECEIRIHWSARERTKERRRFFLLPHWERHFSSPLTQNTASIWARVMGIVFAHVLLLLACVRAHCSLIGFKFQVQRETHRMNRRRVRVKDCQCEMKNAYTKNASTKKLSLLLLLLTLFLSVRLEVQILYSAPRLEQVNE